MVQTAKKRDRLRMVSCLYEDEVKEVEEASDHRIEEVQQFKSDLDEEEADQPPCPYTQLISLFSVISSNLTTEVLTSISNK